MSAPVSNNTPALHGDRGGRLIASYWVQGFFAILVVALRMWARKIAKTTGWDDWLMVLCLVLYLLLAALVTYSATIGGFGHLAALTPAETERVLKVNYAYQVVAAWGLTPGKASVAILIYRIMRPLRGWRFWVLVVSITILTLISTLNCIFTFVQCNPAAYLWDKSIQNAKCWPSSVQTDFAILTASINVALDVILAVIPATIFYGLQIGLEQKVGLTILMGLGVAAAITGAVKTAQLVNLSARSDLTWSIYGLVLLAGVELWLVIMAGSIPPIKPLWTKYVSKEKLKASFNSALSSARGPSRRATALQSGDEMELYDPKSGEQSDQSGKDSTASSTTAV